MKWPNECQLKLIQHRNKQMDGWMDALWMFWCYEILVLIIINQPINQSIHHHHHHHRQFVTVNDSHYCLFVGLFACLAGHTEEVGTPCGGSRVLSRRDHQPR
jgi:hypothetical protein